MANPNSLLTKVRRILTSIIEPWPDPGKAWCIECCDNHGITQVVNTDSLENHIKGHSGELVVKAKWK